MRVYVLIEVWKFVVRRNVTFSHKVASNSSLFVFERISFEVQTIEFGVISAEIIEQTVYESGVYVYKDLYDLKHMRYSSFELVDIIVAEL